MSSAAGVGGELDAAGTIVLGGDVGAKRGKVISDETAKFAVVIIHYDRHLARRQSQGRAKPP